MSPVTLVTWLFAPEWLTLEQASQLSGHDEARLLTLIADGDLVAEPDGASWKVEKASLREFQESLFALYAG